MKTNRTLAGLSVIAVMAVASVAGAQTTPPPVLSTVPTPSPGASAHPSQMSGLPLQVGDLPPGIVAVRVIRGDFTQNVVSQKVELQLGTSGQSRDAVTGQDGRAQFAGLQVGQTVTARALVDGETLESQPFVLPSEGGVRVVLVADAGQAPSALPTPADVSPDLSTPEQHTARPAWAESTAIVPAFFALVTIGVAAWWLRPARHRD